MSLVQFYYYYYYYYYYFIYFFIFFILFYFFFIYLFLFQSFGVDLFATNFYKSRSVQTIFHRCPVAGAPFGPSRFVRSSAAGNVPFTISASGKAQLLNGRGTFWVPCKVGYCTEVDDPCCQQVIHCSKHFITKLCSCNIQRCFKL